MAGTYHSVFWNFQPGLDTTIAQHEDSSLIKSIAITEYFKGLSICVEQILPDGIADYIKSNDTETHVVSEIKELMMNVLNVVDKESLLAFLQKYISKIPKLKSRQVNQIEFFVYLGDLNEAETLKSDLINATNLDIQDLINATKKGVLSMLAQLTLKFQHKLVQVDSICLMIIPRLTQYEWVCKLTCNQSKIIHYLKLGRSRLLNAKEKAGLIRLIGIDISLPEDLSDVLNLLQEYGVIKHLRKSKQKHDPLTITAHSLSLHDIMNNTELVDNIYHHNEIHIVCAETFYIDASMESRKLAGKILAIVSSRIVVKGGNRIIDVSGLHGRSGPTARANDGKKSHTYGPGNHGDNGAHGEPGMSGGKIVIYADEIVNSGQLTLRSCGGNGGNGQDGGNGQNARAKDSEFDNLSRFEGKNASFFSDNYRGFGLRNLNSEIKSHYTVEKEEREFIPFVQQNVYTYGKSPDSGVQILYGLVNESFALYSFLFSKSVDGVSYSGGNAGQGGKGGGGGYAGKIEIRKRNQHLNYNHNVAILNLKGQDGKPGKTGKGGERAIVERKPDHLLVDAGGKPLLKYDDYIIDVVAWNRSDKTGELGRGKYYCHPRVSQCLEPTITENDKHIGFFKSKNQERTLHKHVENGKAQQQYQIIPATVINKPIDLTALHTESQLLTSQKLIMTDHSSLILSLKQLETILSEQLQQLETVHVKQHYKQIRQMNSRSNSFSDAGMKTVSKIVVAKNSETSNIYPDEQLFHMMLDENPWISKEDQEFIVSNGIPVTEKYSKIRDILETHVLKLRQHDEQSRHQCVLNELKSSYMYSILEYAFIPVVSIMHFEDSESIKSVIHFLTGAKDVIFPEFCDGIDRMIATVMPTLLQKYRLCVLIEAHQRLIEQIPYEDPDYQLKAVTIHRKICEQTTIGRIDSIYQTYFATHKKHFIQPFHKSLPNFETLCDAILPLSTDTKTFLETLMAFINLTNETHSGILYIPNILQAIELEYEVYQCTINNSDLLFIMTYIQDQLNQLLDKSHLEDLFCEGLFMKQNELHKYEKVGYIIYQENSYKIDAIEHIGQKISIALTLSKHPVSTAQRFNQFIQTKTHSLMNICHNQVTLDGKLIKFPDVLLVSRVDINNLWSQIKKCYFKERRIPGDKQLELMINKTLSSLSMETQIDYKFQLDLLLQKAHSAQDFPYDVFSYFPPSQWVEQLILHSVRKKFQHHLKFYTDIKQTITGLSRSFDKTLYCHLYNQFLQTFKLEKGEKFKIDLFKVLNNMKAIFIEQNLCSLVTKQGITEAWPDVSAEAVFDDLQDTGLIDSTGIFLPNVTEHTIQLYCNTFQLHSQYLSIVYTMQKYLRDLCNKELSFWCHRLFELRLRFFLNTLTVDNDSKVHDQMLVHLHQLVRHHSEQMIFNFLAQLTSMKDKVSGVVLQELIEKCSSGEWIFPIVIKHLKSYNSLARALNSLSSYNWESELCKQRTADIVIDSIKSQLSKSSSHLVARLDAIKNKIIEIKDMCDKPALYPELHFIPIREYTSEHVAQWTDLFKKEIEIRKQNGIKQLVFNDPLVTQAFAVIQRGIMLFYLEEKQLEGVVPRDTQMVASLLFCQDLSAQGGASHGTKLMQQISTGEGKTMILCMVAIYKALLQEKIDIVTSSSVLAIRDATEQKRLYNLFNISVAHCCHEDIKKRQQAYEADVVYGDIGSFQRDMLETLFYDREIRTNRGFDNVLVDEVDSMLVDKGENMLYLPHALPDMNALDQIYLEIWSLVNAQDFVGFADEQTQLHFYLMQKIFGSIAPNTFSAVSAISETQSEEIFQCLINNGIIDHHTHCLTTTYIPKIQKAIGLIELIREHYLEKEILMIIQQHIETKSLISTIPNTLHPFIKKSLKPWVESAVHAKYFQEYKEYIVDIDRRESASDRYPKIIIMDNETGVKQESSEWGNGLHQFLQLKHNLRLSTESLKAVYMSNISFFTEYYMNMMGVTGTLGSVEEHSLFNKLYEDIQILMLPTNKPSRLKIEVPVCCSTKEMWETAIDQNIQEKLDQNRVVLLICEDVKRAMHLHQSLKTRHKNWNPELYFDSHDKRLEEKGKFTSGQLIIATNIAGRGTDIKLSDKVIRKGGLHVLLSYLPPNIRVELQAYGRAARSGEPGSCKMIFYDKEGDLSYAIRRRDLHEAYRVADIELDYFQNIQFQEKLFDKFKDLYCDIKSRVKAKPKGRPELDYSLDCWAYFLDEYTDAIEQLPKMSAINDIEAEKQRILQAFEVKVKERSTSLSSSRFIQLGHVFMKQAVKCGNKFEDAGNRKNYKKSMDAYNRAVSLNPKDPFARYYLAAALLNHTFSSKNTMFDEGIANRRALKQQFYELIPLLEEKIKQCRCQMTMLQIANRHQDQSVTAGELYFEKQKQHEIEVYSYFISTMQDVLGKDINEGIFDHADWGEEGAQVLFQIIKKEFSLKYSRVAKNYEYRLKEMLTNQTVYYTYHSKIKKKIEALRLRTSAAVTMDERSSAAVTMDDFVGILPDKQEFWNLLKKHHLITNETEIEVNVNAPKKEKFGYWNPTKDASAVCFKEWEIKAESFDWIDELSTEDKKLIVSHLKQKGVLNHNGQLIDFNLAKPLDLPDSLTPVYKGIKDTLWNHACYHFVLDHLCESAKIDMVNDITDSSVESSDHYHDKVQLSISMKPIKSVIDLLISMNPKANASSAHDIQHIQPLSSGGSSISLNDDGESPSILDHVPNEAMNQELLERLAEHNLRITYVSGSGLNCLINVMIQHAKQDYLTPNFTEAEDIRKNIQQKHPNFDLTGMLHCDEKSAEVILNLVNDACSSQIQVVSVVMASSDGPIIYGGTCDKRFTAGRHVAIWQQGNHYVSIVHHEELVNANYQCETTKASGMEEEIPKLSLKQLKILGHMSIVTKSKGCYKICKRIDQIKSVLASDTSGRLSNQDKDQMLRFLCLKLEVDFRTLCNSPRQLLTDQHIVLYDDLCQYAVIKGIKMKKKGKEIKKICGNVRIEDSNVALDMSRCAIAFIPFYFDDAVLNDFLKQKKLGIELTQGKLIELKTFLSERKTIFHIISCKMKQHDWSGINILDSVDFLNQVQKRELKGFVNLMLKLRDNASFIISTLKKQQSSILELETPEITLRRLADVFEDSIQEKGDVLGWFSDNQCDLIIDLAEEKWSWKTIFVATSVIAFGVAQIVLGAVLLVAFAGTGSFFCNGLISEGVSDMIFGIEGLVRGHCNWSQYFEHKLISMAITVATAGLGAIFARGKEVSRYAYKAFGSVSKEVAKSTAEEMGKSFEKVMVKSVTKKISKKVAGAVTDAGINLACERIVDEMSQAIDYLSGSIIDMFDTMSQDEDLQQQMFMFLKKEDPEKAEKYLHQIFVVVSQQNTILEIWDEIESKVKKGAGVLTGAHGNASKHLQMLGENLKGKSLMKAIGYASRFAPLITESVKIGMVKTKMNSLKVRLQQEFKRHEFATHDKISLDENEIKRIMEQEIKILKQSLSEQVSQRGKTILTTGLTIISHELKKHATKLGKDVAVHQIKGHIDMRQLQRYERDLQVAKSDENHSMISKYEKKLHKLMSRTRNPKVFARMIEHHDALLGPAFAIPALEKIIGRPIHVQNEDGKPLLNVQQQHAQGEPLVIKFRPGGGDELVGHYFVAGQKFSHDEHGNNCLINAAMRGAGVTDFEAIKVRKDIARACLDSTHPCNSFIKSGIAHNYVEIGLVGGAARPKFWNGIYPYLARYAENTQKLEAKLQRCKKFNNKGKKTLRDLSLDVCHILSFSDIKTMIELDLNSKNKKATNLNRLMTLLPTIEEVSNGKSHLGNRSGKNDFLKEFKDDKVYADRVKEARDIVNRFKKKGKMNASDHGRLLSILNSAPINLRLENASENRRVQAHLHNIRGDEATVESIHKKFPNCTPPLEVQ